LSGQFKDSVRLKRLVLFPVRAGNHYLYSFDGKLLRQYDIFGVLLKDLIHMGDRLVAEYDRVGNRYLYYTQDQISSTRAVTDGSGTVVYSEAYNPYGGVHKTWVNSFDPLPKFSGKERDEESGLDYFGARYYDRAQYRFVSTDPKLIVERARIDPQRWNLYSYCMNNPLAFHDLDGMDAISVQEGLKITMIASTKAMGTPYESPGNTLGSEGGADCSGATWAIYNEAGFQYNHVSTCDFGNSLKPGGKNEGRFDEIKDATKLQVGDIGVWCGHMVIYGGKKDGVEIVYSAHKPGVNYAEDTLSVWVKSKGGKDPTWYRYNKTDEEDNKDTGKH
jgi:RHS repeat-associated protein